jgi:cytochrome c oxidase assembly factor 3
MPQSSYYDKQNKPTAALYRARQPYLVKNIGTGLVLLGFVGAVCT